MSGSRLRLWPTNQSPEEFLSFEDLRVIESHSIVDDMHSMLNVVFRKDMRTEQL